ncbi:uncharacterized protein ISCGN_009573 [Ixodes scapularis]
MTLSMCTSMPSVGRLVYLYACPYTYALWNALQISNLLALVGETAYGVAVIGRLEEEELTTGYIQTSINALLRTVTITVCAYWILSANNGDQKGMKFAFYLILLRTIGNVMYAYGNVLYEVYLMYIGQQLEEADGAAPEVQVERASDFRSGITEKPGLSVSPAGNCRPEVPVAQQSPALRKSTRVRNAPQRYSP